MNSSHWRVTAVLFESNGYNDIKHFVRMKNCSFSMNARAARATMRCFFSARFSQHLSLFPSEGWWRRIEWLQHSSSNQTFSLILSLVIWRLLTLSQSITWSTPFTCHSISLIRCSVSFTHSLPFHLRFSSRHTNSPVPSFLVYIFVVIFLVTLVIFSLAVVVVVILSGIRFVIFCLYRSKWMLYAASI